MIIVGVRFGLIRFLRETGYVVVVCFHPLDHGQFYCCAMYTKLPELNVISPVIYGLVEKVLNLDL